MRKSFLIGLILALLFLGCVTTEDMPNPEIARLQNRAQVLQEELRQTQEQNLSLKERIAELEKVSLRMPVAKEIQRALRNAGFYKGEIDGQIGSRTKEAIRKFQEANGINPDGVVGSRTWQLLAKYLNNSESK